MRAAVRAELLKIATVRSLWLGAVLAAAAVPLFSLLVVGTDKLGVDDTITSGAATGTIVGLLAFGAWAGTLAASEYAHRTMSVSLATVPRRGVLLGAKLLATGLVSGGASLVSAAVALAVVRLTAAPGEHELGNPAALLALVAAVVAVAVLGAAVGILTRSTTASIAIVALAVLLPKAAGSLLGGLEAWVVGASPATVVTQVVGGAQLASDQTYPPGDLAAVLTMAAVAAAVATAAAAVLHRRDG
jgi:ABC-type transport system involved in multi-copper enzyme maturation permease subunit